MASTLNISVRNRLVEENIPLAKRITKDLWSLGRLKHLGSFADALQESYVALTQAVEKFDKEHERANWGGYLAQVIRRHLLRESKMAGVIRTPAHALGTRSKEKADGVYEDAVKAKQTVSAGNVWSKSENNDSALGHPFYTPDFLDLLMTREIRETLIALPAELRNIIEKRFGLKDSELAWTGAPAEGLTLDQVGAECSLTRERIRQKQVRAIQLLREAYGIPA